MLSRLDVTSCGCKNAAAGCGACPGVAAAGTAAIGEGPRGIVRAADLSGCGGGGGRMRPCPSTGWLDTAAARNRSAATALTRFVDLWQTAHERNMADHLADGTASSSCRPELLRIQAGS